MKRSIIWLASYPKSGNTWTRLFLANYLMNAQEPVPINQAHRFAVGDAVVKMYNRVAGREIDPQNLSLSLRLRDGVLRGIVANNADVNFVKTHNARVAPEKIELIPDRYTRSAIYIIRNPLDMVLSYARHYGITQEDAANKICHPDNGNLPTETSVAQYLSSWDMHVKSWMAYAPWKRLILRYEDLLDDPETHFAKVLDLVGVPVDKERLQRAIRFCSFDELSRQEEEQGFIERPEQSEKFFGKGQKDQWKTDLDPALAEMIRAKMGETMKRYGYLE
ncbi:MAG: sulfotransferase domain-containing protein [Roseovarius sp.]|uniref:sulfotransferase domain-containing protein n=1 Tax=Roseovarius sp. TaxID=1486281 RepID=UPI001B407B81|nr:sulfotransferase domain-containing protein [Roseovarius sp.]MBQ0750268.1 sulfotransferase domain-containing protein [Roseovarius sp.]MBQ0809636.1 sulfotransferase domain-containing protein [Roseovarius sp.]